MSTTQFYGSITPTLLQAHTVGTVVNPGVYLFKVDTGQMTLGDTVRLDVNTKLKSGTVANEFSATYGNRQSSQIKSSPPVVVDEFCTVQIRQLTGTPRLFPFQVISI